MKSGNKIPQGVARDAGVAGVQGRGLQGMQGMRASSKTAKQQPNTPATKASSCRPQETGGSCRAAPGSNCDPS